MANKPVELPVIEVFGPVIQGEGAMIGEQTMFVRFGGCDYRCSWCDTLYAVLPKEVKRNSTLMSIGEIVLDLITRSTCRTVTLSGGNPCIYDLSELCEELAKCGYRIALETQGSLYRPWVRRCHVITVSPKGPSSGMEIDMKVLEEFVSLDRANIKVVIFSEEDIEFAKTLRTRFPSVDFYLQIGTTPGGTSTSVEEIRKDIFNRMDWVVDRVLNDRTFKDVKILPQMHTLMYGHRRGI